jgi:hypothetical protein
MCPAPKKYHLLLCELHYPDIHGKTIDSCPDIEQHYLLYDKYNSSTGIAINDYFPNNDDVDDADEHINTDLYMLKKMYAVLSKQSNIRLHPTIRNYHNIIKRPNYIQPEIGECILLSTQEEIVILKTFWLRIIQRKWKKVFQERIRIKGSISNLHMREIRKQNIRIPGLRGMLCELNTC